MFACRRFLDGGERLVFNNLTGKEIRLSGAPCPAGYWKRLGNYPDAAAEDGCLLLRPYESIVYQKEA